MATYSIKDIINVNMYNSILSPEFTLEEDMEISEEKWHEFDFKKYAAIVCEYAIIELKKLLERLPDEMRCTYVEGSAHIFSPKYYNYGGDRLFFKVECHNNTTENDLQDYLDRFFDDDWKDEFGADYRIYEYIRCNCSVESFITNETVKN